MSTHINHTCILNVAVPYEKSGRVLSLANDLSASGEDAAEGNDQMNTPAQEGSC